jgi:RimJ/RimL family protein N-acetyltransferase
MLVQPEWPAAEVIETVRLSLEPLRADHAAEMAPLLDDEALHRYMGGQPATRGELHARYRRQAAGRSPDGQERWLNWVVRHRASGTAVGIVQATLRRAGEHLTAELAWVIASKYQRRGCAGEAAIGMTTWLGRHGVQRLIAHVHPEHRASVRVAERLGLAPTDVVVDGEIRWATRA